MSIDKLVEKMEGLVDEHEFEETPSKVWYRAIATCIALVKNHEAHELEEKDAKCNDAIDQICLHKDAEISALEQQIAELKKRLADENRLHDETCQVVLDISKLVEEKNQQTAELKKQVSEYQQTVLDLIEMLHFQGCTTEEINDWLLKKGKVEKAEIKGDGNNMNAEEKLKIAIQALEDIENPLLKMEREMPQGCRLDGHMACMMAEDHNFLKREARDALRKIK